MFHGVAKIEHKTNAWDQREVYKQVGVYDFTGELWVCDGSVQEQNQITCLSCEQKAAANCSNAFPWEGGMQYHYPKSFENC